MTAPNYGLMSDPYNLIMNYEDGTSIDHFDPELMDFNKAIDLAHKEFQGNIGGNKLTNIFITVHDRLALVVYPNEKHIWPDWSDSWSKYRH